jgi:hypothetical protein
MLDKPLEPLMSEDAEIEIEIENPESVSIGIDGLEVVIEPGKDTEDEFDSNLAEFMSESELQTLASDLIGEVDADIGSRKDWVDMYVKGLEVLGMKYEDLT